jgi:hypothetical protein
MDFTVIARVRARFGATSNAEGFGDLETNAPFVGKSKTWTFDCPNVDTGRDAVLVFQALGVQHNRNLLSINGAAISGGIPYGGFTLITSGNAEREFGIWSAQCLLIPPNTLRVSNNQLTVEARDRSGGSGDDVAKFVLDNIVLMFHTRSGSIIDGGVVTS